MATLSRSSIACCISSSHKISAFAYPDRCKHEAPACISLQRNSAPTCYAMQAVLPVQDDRAYDPDMPAPLHSSSGGQCRRFDKCAGIHARQGNRWQVRLRVQDRLASLFGCRQLHTGPYRGSRPVQIQRVPKQAAGYKRGGLQSIDKMHGNGLVHRPDEQLDHHLLCNSQMHMRYSQLKA